MRRLPAADLILLLLLPCTGLCATTYKLLVWGDCRPWTTSGAGASTGLKSVARRPGTCRGGLAGLRFGELGIRRWLRRATRAVRSTQHSRSLKWEDE